MVYIGIRELDEFEKKTIERLGIEFYGPIEIEDLGGIGNVWRKVNDQLKLNKSGNILHLSFDVDSLCPYYLSATGTVAHFGLTSREALYILRKA